MRQKILLIRHAQTPENVFHDMTHHVELLPPDVKTFGDLEEKKLKAHGKTLNDLSNIIGIQYPPNQFLSPDFYDITPFGARISQAVGKYIRQNLSLTTDVVGITSELIRTESTLSNIIFEAQILLKTHTKSDVFDECTPAEWLAEDARKEYIALQGRDPYTAAEIGQRVKDKLEELCSLRPNSDVIAVMHGNVSHLFLQHLMRDSPPERLMDNCGMRILERDSTGICSVGEYTSPADMLMNIIKIRPGVPTPH